jgi:hypothetical protein
VKTPSSHSPSLSRTFVSTLFHRFLLIVFRPFTRLHHTFTTTPIASPSSRS